MENIRTGRKLKRFKVDQLEFNVWQRLTRVLVIAAFTGFAMLVFSFFVPEWEQLQEMDRENAMLQARLDKLTSDRRDRLQDELHTSTDIGYLEVVARDRLNLQLPGEVIFRIQRQQ